MTHIQRTRTRRRTWLRVRAVLAGGLVLGVGAGVTLASWNDSEYASGTVTTSTFDLESSLENNPGSFSSHPEQTPLVLDFEATNMGPTSVRQEQIFIRNTGNIDGTYTFSAPGMSADDSSAPLKDYLNYRAIETTGSCTEASFTSGATYLAGGESTWASIGSAPATTRNIAAGGAAVGICIQLQLDSTTPNDRQGTSATVQFVTTATSITP